MLRHPYVTANRALEDVPLCWSLKSYKIVLSCRVLPFVSLH